jgi:hypothetical protein
MQTKFIEGNVPDHLRVHVVYLLSSSKATCLTT